MRFETREQMQAAVDAGITIYNVYGLGDSSYLRSYDLSGMDLIDIQLGRYSDNLCPFIVKADNPEKPILRAIFSLHDQNIDGGGYNDHRSFDNEDEAKEYLEWAKVNTEAPEPDYYYE